jgi:hypothetical protein
MATLKQIWLDNKGTEHGTEREADLQDLIYVSEAEVDAWLTQQVGLKKPSEYARVLKMWEGDRIRREYEYKEAQPVPSQPQMLVPKAPSESLFKAGLLDAPPDGDDDDFDFKGATMVRV